MRIEERRGQLLERGEPFYFSWNGQDVVAYQGETVLGALLAAGEHSLSRTDKGDRPRLMLCGMGACFACLVAVDGAPHLRACMTPAAPGLNVSTVQPVEQVN